MERMSNQKSSKGTLSLAVKKSKSSQKPIIVCCDEMNQQVFLCSHLAQDFDDITACSLRKLESVLAKQPDSILVVSWQQPCGELKWIIELAEHNNIPLISFINQLKPMDSDRLPNSSGYVLLSSIPTEPLKGWLEYAEQVRANAQSQRQTISDLEQKLEERKWVEQAKALLMKLHNIDEKKAYQALRSTAMKNSQTMGQVAKNLLVTFEHISL